MDKYWGPLKHYSLEYKRLDGKWISLGVEATCIEEAFTRAINSLKCDSQRIRPRQCLRILKLR